MRVLALLPDDSFAALKRALGATDIVARLGDVEALERAMKGSRVDAIVVDPVGFDNEEWERAQRIISMPLMPVLIYARLDQESVQRVVAASAVGVHEVLLRELDDDPIALRRRLETLRKPPAPAQVLSRLAGRISALPPLLQRATLPLFCAAPIPRWADEMARAAHMSRRSVDRWMGHAGLAGTASVLDVARLARVWAPIVDEKIPVATVALRGGYKRLRLLALHTRRLVGASPTSLEGDMNQAEFVSRLTRFALRG
jgi:AraC-like DNA-binding protein